MSGRVVIFNVFGHRNTGDAMLLESLVDLIAEHRPLADVEGIAFDVGAQRKWMPEIRWHERVGNKTQSGGGGRIRQALGLLVTLAIAGSRIFLPLKRLLPAEQRGAIDALDGAELAISCPGGYLEDSRSAYILNLVQMLLARRLARKTVLAPQSIGPIRSGFGRALAGFTLRGMDAVYVREGPSVAFVRSVMPAGDVPVLESGDLAFWYGRRRAAGLAAEWERLGVDPARPIIGMTVVEWTFPHHPDPAAAQAAYLDALASLVRKVQGEGTHQVVLFNQVSSDLPVAELLAARVPGVILDRFDRDSGVFADMIARCELFVGSRFHSCIFGLLGSVPTIAIAYLPKTVGIMSDLGLSDFVLPIDTISGDALIAAFVQLRERRQAVSHRLGESVAHYRSVHGRFNQDLAYWMDKERSREARPPSMARA